MNPQCMSGLKIIKQTRVKGDGAEFVEYSRKITGVKSSEFALLFQVNAGFRLAVFS